jgi:hypothetical protein
MPQTAAEEVDLLAETATLPRIRKLDAGLPANESDARESEGLALQERLLVLAQMMTYITAQLSEISLGVNKLAIEQPQETPKTTLTSTRKKRSPASRKKARSTVRKKKKRAAKTQDASI